jgi:hypothetical protein
MFNLIIFFFLPLVTIKRQLQLYFKYNESLHILLFYLKFHYSHSFFFLFYLKK